MGRAETPSHFLKIVTVLSESQRMSVDHADRMNSSASPPIRAASWTSKTGQTVMSKDVLKMAVCPGKQCRIVGLYDGETTRAVY